MNTQISVQPGSQHLVFWQNFPNHLQAPLLRSLANQSELRVSLICQEEIPEWRRSLGWQAPDFGNANVIINPDDEILKQLLAQSDLPLVHILSGTRGNPLVWRALNEIINTDARIAIYSETQDWRGIKGLVRRLRAYMDALRLRSRVDFILAIGHMGTKWFRQCSYPQSMIYPFGYFVETPSNSLIAQPLDSTPKSAVRLIMIGQCIHRKGIDILLRALKGIAQYEWFLEIIGDGPERTKLMQLACSLGLSSRVQFLGALPNEAAMQRLSQSDLLVLPSRWDGWGAVVNEALMRGVPVVCSDHCGAADLLGVPERGAVFPSGSVDSLRAKLLDYIAQGRRSEEARRKLIEWSKIITGESAARYLMEILDTVKANGMRPSPPWSSARETNRN